MPKNDDLLAGYQIGGDVRPPFVSAPQVTNENKDLFAGLQVGNQRIPDIEFEKQRRETIESIPEIGTGGLLAGEDQSKVAAISPVLLSTTDPREMANIVASTFPNIGITETPEGELLATNNKTGAMVVVNKPGLSQLDILQGLGIVSAFFPAAGAASIPARIGGAIATESVIQAGQAAAGGEFDVGDVALSGALSGAGELLPKGFQAGAQLLKQSRKAKQVAPTLKEVKEVAVIQAEEAAKETGVGLFEAQKTMVPSTLEEQSFVASLPAGARTARAALLKQNEQAAKAVDDILNFIAPPTALETGAKKIRTAANQALQARKLARSEAASPIYKQAFRRQRQGKVGLIDTGALQTKISKMAQQFDPDDEIAKSLNDALRKIENANGDLRKLHIAKIEIDQKLNAFGVNAVGNTTKRHVKSIQDDLIEQMRAQSPSYMAAMDEFKRTSPAVQSFEDSVLGKITDIDETQLKTISQKLFNPAEQNPVLIRKAKKTIEAIDPQAWREIIRTELERRLGAVRGDISESAQGISASVENLPAQLSRAIFGNEKQRRVLFQGSPPDIAQNLKYLETALDRARLGRPGGSQTATREEIKKQLRPGITKGVATSIVNFFNFPVRAVGVAGDVGTGLVGEKLFDRKVRVLADALYSTEWKARMVKIRKMPSGSSSAGKAMLQLLNDVEKSQEVQEEQ